MSIVTTKLYLLYANNYFIDNNAVLGIMETMYKDKTELLNLIVKGTKL